MRRGAIAALVAVVLGLAPLVAAVRLVRPEEWRAPLEATLSGALRRPVRLGALRLRLLPLPAVYARDVRTGSDAAGAVLQIRIAELRLRPALLPLLFGRVVPRALELDAPEVLLDPGAREPPSTSEPSPDVALPAALPLELVRVTGGSLRVGRWSAEELELVARVGPDGRTAGSFDSVLPAGGRLRGRLALEGPPGAGLSGRLEGRIEGAELAALAPLLELDCDCRGRVAGRLELELRAGRLAAASLALEGDPLSAVLGALRVEGPVRLAAALGGEWSLDLTAAEVRLPGLRKPPGLRLAALGPVAAPVERALAGLRLSLGGESLPLDLDLQGPGPAVALRPARLPAVALAPLLEPGGGKLGGQLATSGLVVATRPLSALGDLVLDGVSLERPEGQVALSGTLYARGSRVETDGLVLRTAGRPVWLVGDYDYASDRLSASLEADRADLAALLGALTGEPRLAGRLRGRLDLQAAGLRAGNPESLSLEGTGRVEIAGARVRGIALLPGLLEELLGVPASLVARGPRGLRAPDVVELDRLRADFTLRGRRLETGDLILDHRGASAELQGGVDLFSGELALRGRLVIGPALDAELSRAFTLGSPRVIPIERVSGTLSHPRVRLDRAALAEVAARYAIPERMRGALEERLGPGGAGLVDRILSALLAQRESIE